MADVLDFKKLAEATEVEEVLDTDTVFVERDGVIYRVPKDKVCGSGTYVLKPKLEDITTDESTGMMIINTNYDDLAKAMEKGMSVMLLEPASTEVPVQTLYTITFMAYADETIAAAQGLPSSGVMIGSEMFGQAFLPNGSYVPTL